MSVRELAQAVVVSAVMDYLTGGGYCTNTKTDSREVWRDDAERFLFSDSEDSTLLRRTWCEFAGLDMEYIQNGVRKTAATGSCANGRELKKMLKSIRAKKDGE